jgi:hypothetical protein
MQRSSSSIANLAGALAKAQIALVNPEKSLVATIRQGGASRGEQTFRYAPLSSGLEIVRKTLGEHEIATVQTTAIDQRAGIVNLTTVLAHSSGEWISSDWPVCAVSETATPHRMGAALTYARRYALFTLVGIAGEDDLDAPDLMTPSASTSEPEKPNAHGNGGALNGRHWNNRAQRGAPGRYAGNGRRPPFISAKTTLRAEQSAELRDRLLVELGNVRSSEDAALWALRSLPEKDRLTAVDARRVEETFEAHIIRYATDAEDEHRTSGQTAEPKLPTGLVPGAPAPRTRSRTKRIAGAIDKSALAFPEPRRVRDRDHIRYVARQPCLICGRQPSDAHHLRFAQHPALGRKVSDEFTVPLCRGHHREIHRCGDEAAWWSTVGIEPTAAARLLWLKTHPLPAIGKTAAADLMEVRRDPPVGKRSKVNETKPIAAGGT